MSADDRLEQSLRHVLSVEAADGGGGGGCDARALYRFASGEAGADEASAFERHLATCEGCRAALAPFRPLPAPMTQPQPQPRESASFLRRLLGGWTLIPAAAIASVMIAFALWRPGPDPSGLTIKSGYRLHVAVQRGERRFVATSGSTLELGDTLGLFYTAPEDAYLTVLVADEAGAVTQAFPSGAAAPLPRGVEQRLEVGAVVERGTACEWIVGVFSARPLAADSARDALKKAVAARAQDCTLPALGLPGAAVDTFLLRRSAP